MRVVRTIEELGGAGGLGGVVVPTMGALHAGHGALVERARTLAGAGPGSPQVVVTVFVNPTQFNDARDYARYPRTLDDDAALAECAGADLLFAPDASEVYPPGATVAVPELPAVAIEPGLEDRHRPGHFAGVCQVVARLFDMLAPTAAVFGEKDWQQLQVVRALAERRHPPMRIVGVATEREPDGLAMSSRNRFLTAEERAAAAAIPRALMRAWTPFNGAWRQAEQVMAETLDAAGLRTEYAVVREARTLRPACADADPPANGPGNQGELRALIAAWSGSVRLIDNAPFGPEALGLGQA